jgi:hypothetical protein
VFQGCWGTAAPLQPRGEQMACRLVAPHSGLSMQPCGSGVQWVERGLAAGDAARSPNR